MPLKGILRSGKAVAFLRPSEAAGGRVQILRASEELLEALRATLKPADFSIRWFPYPQGLLELNLLMCFTPSSPI